MDWITVVIVAVIGWSGWHGWRLGFGRTALPLAGFAVGFGLGAWLASLLSVSMTVPTDRFLLLLLTAVLIGLLGLAVGEWLNAWLEPLAERLHLAWLNRLAGAGLQIAMMALLVWFVAAGVQRLPASAWGTQLATSPIVRALNRLLPAPPAIVSNLAQRFGPNGFPEVYLGGSPERALIDRTQTVDNAKIAVAEQSVVQLSGRGCGGYVEGSGFVIAPQVVVTNAHVIAGVRRPIVLDGTGRHAATPVYFDPATDVAVLRTTDLAAPPLTAASTQLERGAAGAVLGFPGGGPLAVRDAVTLQLTQARGQDIYGTRPVTRTIYELAADIQPGNSGGPLIDAAGQLAGVIFAKSLSQQSVGYALVWQDIEPAVTAALAKTAAVSTDRCSQD